MNTSLSPRSNEEYLHWDHDDQSVSQANQKQANSKQPVDSSDINDCSPTDPAKPMTSGRDDGTTFRNRAEQLSRDDEADDEEDKDKVQSIQEIRLPSQLYSQLFHQFPPNPLLPKSFSGQDDMPRSGSLHHKMMKLAKFRGVDYGRSKFREEAAGVEKIQLPEGITMKKLFKVINQKEDLQITTNGIQSDKVKGDKAMQDAKSNAQKQQAPVEISEKKNEPLMTAYGELVYQRNGSKDFLAKHSQKTNTGTYYFQEPKDEVLEENLLDVKNLLKFSTSSQAASGSNAKNQGQKSLVNLQGVEPFYQKKNDEDNTLIFESRFESGNLAAALKVADDDYYLALQNDVNTSGNTQWFFFRVSNTHKGHSVRFSMLNLCKPDSLYNEGMKVLIYSEKHAQEKDIGWQRGGNKIAYYPNGIKKDGVKGFRTLYTMTFTYEFEYDDDRVYFAYCYPYTYTELVEELNQITNDPIKQLYVHRRNLVDTLAGNKCEVLTITSRQNPENMAQRKGVILTARVHPGESVASWMMKGALDFLVDPDSIEAEYLRQNFVFKVVPMLNPDGVINGNYRCSLAGCDLNRRWKRPSKVLHPTIFATKQLCHQFSKERDLEMFCDFHGHSRRKNIFMYGCNVAGQPEDTRLFPFVMSHLCPFFVYGYSRFGNQKSKEATARMALFNELKCPAIYTIEASFCGNDMGPFKNYHFSTANLMQTGRDFCRTLILYLPIAVPKPLTCNFMQIINDLYQHYKMISDSKIKSDPEIESMNLYFERLDKVKSNNKEIQTKHLRKGMLAVLRQTADIFSDANSSSSAGSDNAPSEDNLDLEEIEKVLPVQEDPDLANKVKKAKSIKIENELSAAEQAPAQKKSANQGNQSLNKQKNETSKNKQKIPIPRSNTLKKKVSKMLSQENVGTDDQKDCLPLGDGSNRLKNKESLDRDEENDKVGELMQDSKGQTIHKKRRRKNVESKDAWTQTDRSDYLLIKQRQQEKQLRALLASKQILNKNSTSQVTAGQVVEEPLAAEGQKEPTDISQLQQPAHLQQFTNPSNLIAQITANQGFNDQKIQETDHKPIIKRQYVGKINKKGQKGNSLKQKQAKESTEAKKQTEQIQFYKNEQIQQQDNVVHFSNANLKNIVFQNTNKHASEKKINQQEKVSQQLSGKSTGLLKNTITGNQLNQIKKSNGSSLLSPDESPIKLTQNQKDQKKQGYMVQFEIPEHPHYFHQQANTSFYPNSQTYKPVVNNSERPTLGVIQDQRSRAGLSTAFGMQRSLQKIDHGDEATNPGHQTFLVNPNVPPDIFQSAQSKQNEGSFNTKGISFQQYYNITISDKANQNIQMVAPFKRSPQQIFASQNLLMVNSNNSPDLLGMQQQLISNQRDITSQNQRQNTQNLQNQQTNWQRLSQSNKEFTKLFYQLPGGQKTLVQNAIKSHNAFGSQKDRKDYKNDGHNGLHTSYGGAYQYSSKNKPKNTQQIGPKLVGRTSVSSNYQEAEKKAMHYIAVKKQEHGQYKAVSDQKFNETWNLLMQKQSQQQAVTVDGRISQQVKNQIVMQTNLQQSHHRKKLSNHKNAVYPKDNNAKTPYFGVYQPTVDQSKQVKQIAPTTKQKQTSLTLIGQNKSPQVLFSKKMIDSKAKNQEVNLGKNMTNNGEQYFKSDGSAFQNLNPLITRPQSQLYALNKQAAVINPLLSSLNSSSRAIKQVLEGRGEE